MENKKNIDEEKIVSHFHEGTDTVEDISSELRNSKDFIESKKIFEAQEQIKELLALSSEDELWTQIDKRISPVRLFRVWSKYAAIVIISLAIGTLVSYFAQSGLLNPEIAYATLTVPRGQMAQLELPDGTEVWLNSETTFKYPTAFNDDTRDVELVGEAYFNVHTNPDKPFNISTNKSVVQVTGTSLNVRAYNGENEITTLVEGKVRLLNKNKKLLLYLKPSQSAVFDQHNELDVYNIDTKYLTMWKEGKLFVDNISLLDLSHMLERWYNVKINIVDEELKTRNISGTVLKYKPVDQILEILTIRENMKFEMELVPNDRNIITLKKKS
ncbi:FecR family protein [Sunxiuqinia sp. A32]|uniref:FecR family protein n=1 Tax=Sunxiuqinia sp. A32 TaxID=3461496 RepID=UPI0040466959